MDESLQSQREPECGVFEIFFGPAWPRESRLRLASFLKQIEFTFYLYGPKADQHLRKIWREPWSEDYLAELREMAHAFHREGLRFGVALSPWGLDQGISALDESLLSDKLAELEELGCDFVGLFFDDMPVFEGLAPVQLQALNSLMKRGSKMPLVFCPSFYSFDPVLEKVFGARPAAYFDDLRAGLPETIDYLWTGEKVISKSFSSDHLAEVSALFGKAPFVCDNVFANDGPRNCKFLKLFEFANKSAHVVHAAKAWALNPMNQIELSKICLLATSLVVKKGVAPDRALIRAIDQLCPASTAEALKENLQRFSELGLDTFDDNTRSSLAEIFLRGGDGVGREVADWLNGRYVVGAECLTD